MAAAAAQAQIQFVADTNISVEKDGQPLRYAWLGGLNNPQFSAADLNHDNITDLCIFDRYDHRIFTFINDNIPNTISYTYSPQYAAHFPALQNWALLRDYNCDEVPDIFTSRYETLGCYKGMWIDNQLHFELDKDQLLYNQNVLLSIAPTDLPAIDDIDGDGYIDVLTFNPAGGYAWWLRNETTTCGTFNLIKTDACWGNFYESGINTSLELNAECSGKSNTPADATRHPGSTLMTADFDNDGDKELILGDVSFNNLLLALNGGTATDALIVSQDTTFPSYSVPMEVTSFPAAFAADVNNDGLQDLLAAPNSRSLADHLRCSWLYLNEGTPQNAAFQYSTDRFLSEQSIDVGRGAFPAFVDYNNDGLQDLVIGNYGTSASPVSSVMSASLTLYENTGTLAAPKFQWISDDWLQLKQYNLFSLVPHFGDIDSDGDTDLLLGCGGSNMPSQSSLNGMLLLMKNTAPPNTAPYFETPVFGYQGIDVGQNSAPCLYDVNGDGLKDLIIGEKLGKLNYYVNSGTAQQPAFTVVNTFWGQVDVRAESGTGYAMPAVLDLDNDTYADLIVGSENGQVIWFTGIEDDPATAVFAKKDDNLTDVYDGLYTAPAFTDLNQDGKTELVVGNYRGGLSLYSATTYSAIFEAAAPASLQLLQAVPNPVAQGACRLQWQPMHPDNKGSGLLRLSVYTAVGTLVSEQTLPPDTSEMLLHTENWSSGMYIVQLKKGASVVASGKIAVVE